MNGIGFDVGGLDPPLYAGTWVASYTRVLMVATVPGFVDAKARIGHVWPSFARSIASGRIDDILERLALAPAVEILGE